MRTELAHFENQYGRVFLRPKPADEQPPPAVQFAETAGEAPVCGCAQS